MATNTIFIHASESGGSPEADSAVSLGVVFKASEAGNITHISFWKPATSSITSRSVGLYGGDGATESLVASGTSSSEPTGTAQWVDVALDTPYAITANTKYTAVVHFSDGKYSAEAFRFELSAVTNGNLTGVIYSDSTLGNGRYGYGGSISYPTGTYNKANYWVDVVLETSTGDTLTGTLFSNTQTFFGGQLNLKVSGSALTNSQSFPAGSLTKRVDGTLLSNSQSFFGGQLNLQITGSLLTSTQTFPAATISAGVVTVDGTLLTSTQTFPAGTISNSYSIAGTLLENSQSFFGATLSATYAISGTLLTSTQTFPAATITNGSSTVTGSLLTNTSTAYAGQVNMGLSGSLWANTGTFNAGVVSSGVTTVSGTALVNTNTFHSGSLSALISGALLTNIAVFQTGTVQLMHQYVDGTLYVNGSSRRVVRRGPNISWGFW